MVAAGYLTPDEAGISPDLQDLPGIIAACGLIDLELMGPEKNVAGLADATAGNGVSFRVEGSDHGLRAAARFRDG